MGLILRREVLPARVARHVIALTVAGALGLALGLAVLACSGGGSSEPEPQVQGLVSVLSPPPGVSISSLNAGIAGTENGQVLAWNGTTWARNRFTGDPKQRYTFIEEFENGGSCTAGTGKFVGGIGGAPTCAYNVVESGHSETGMLTITTPTGATDGVRMITQGQIQFGNNIGQICARQLVKFPVLSTSVQQTVFRAGFAEPTGTTGADSVDAVEAVYQFSANGGVNKWALTTSSNSTRTTTVCNGTGGTVDAPIVAGTWYEIEECVNAGGTSATLAVNGTICATNTTNIPTGSSRTTTLGLQWFNDTGSVPTTMVMSIDYFWASLPFGVAR